MKYPQRPCNISHVQPSVGNYEEPFVVIWMDAESLERSFKHFKTARPARRFRRKLVNIKKRNLEERYATA